MKKGVQLYAIRALAELDMDKALKTVSDIGYDGVEFAGFFDHDSAQIKAMLKKYNLQVLGAHIAPELMFDNVDDTIAFHKAIGNKRIICPWYDLKTRADVLELADKIKAAAPKYEAAGMKIYYHNHAHEFQKDKDDYLIDILANEVSAEILSLEFDVYWVYRGGENPVAYLNKYKDRVDIFHAKDGIDDVGTALASGAVDMNAVFDFAKKHNMDWAVVESETSEELDNQVAAITNDFIALDNLIGK